MDRSRLGGALRALSRGGLVVVLVGSLSVSGGTAVQAADGEWVDGTAFSVGAEWYVVGSVWYDGATEMFRPGAGWFSPPQSGVTELGFVLCSGASTPAGCDWSTSTWADSGGAQSEPARFPACGSYTLAAYAGWGIYLPDTPAFTPSVGGANGSTVVGTCAPTPTPTPTPIPVVPTVVSGVFDDGPGRAVALALSLLVFLAALGTTRAFATGSKAA